MPSDLDEPNPALDDHELQWHLIYHHVFSDPAVREAMQKHRGMLERKQIFSALYELGGD